MEESEAVSDQVSMEKQQQHKYESTKNLDQMYLAHEHEQCGV